LERKTEVEQIARYQSETKLLEMTGHGAGAGEWIAQRRRFGSALAYEFADVRQSVGF
jgi:hypothetical protein